MINMIQAHTHLHTLRDKMPFNIIRRRDSKICIVTTLRTGDRGIVVRSSAEARYLPFLESVQSDSGNDTVSDLEETMDNLPRCKAAGE